MNGYGQPYLSYSMLAVLDFCEYRYLLEYVERVPLETEPAYFAKGRLFHQAAARMYQALAARRKVSLPRLHAYIDRHAHEFDAPHLKNAIELSVANAFTDWKVVGIEQPFVLSLDDSLPPLIGVIDLVLRQGDRFAVVDHKTGRTFNDLDRLQLAIYREHVLRKYGASECLACYDEYRWVDDLNRIRKPAFQRTRFKFRPQSWRWTLGKIRGAHRRMREIERSGDAWGFGPCYMCPFRDQCPKAMAGFVGHGG